jgi:hypothetical protein
VYGRYIDSRRDIERRARGRAPSVRVRVCSGAESVAVPPRHREKSERRRGNTVSVAVAVR